MTAFRLPGAPPAAILRFTFDGRALTGVAGDTLASALKANGVMLVGRSFKHHRPRGVFAAGLAEPNALVTVGEGAEATPNLPATMVPLHDGLVAVSQNRWPSLERDLLSVNDRLSRFLGAGFYYKTFMAPGRAWEALYEPLIRRAAGLGEAPRDPDPDAYEHVHRHCETLVIGGGAAGLAASEAAARRGGRVVLCEAGPGFAAPPPRGVAALARTIALAAYDQRYVVALETLGEDIRRATGLAGRLHRIRAGAIVLATGAEERLIAFPDNDRPGVMLASAAADLLERHHVAPGRRVAIVTGNDAPYALAERLAALGLLSAILDLRDDPTIPPPAGVRRLCGARIDGVLGRRRVEGVAVTAGGRAEILAADALLVSGGFDPRLRLAQQVGAALRYDGARATFLLDRAPEGWSVVGAAAGDGLPETLHRPDASSGRRARAKAYVDLQNDVTVEDIRQAATEGYAEVEHAKRYTTHGMGTDQGRTGGFVGAAVLAEATGRPIAEVGVSRPRPFAAPATWGALAGAETGPHFKPERRLPLHDWHAAAGAEFAKLGLWLRPLAYPAPGEKGWAAALREAKAVRSGVGLTDVSSLGKIEVHGPDAGRFLDRIYANTFSTLPVGRARYGLMLREDGMVLDDGTTSRLGEHHYYVTTTTANAPTVMEHMEFHRDTAFRDLDVALTSVSEQWAALAVAGPLSRAVLSAAVEDRDLSDAAFPFMACGEAQVAGVSCRLFRISFSGERAYEVAAPAHLIHRVKDAILAAGGAHAIAPYGLDALNILRIEKGHVAGAEISGTVTAQDLGLGRMLKASGDFIGAALARRPAFADPARHRLVGVRMLRGERLKGGAVLVDPARPREALGHLTSIAPSAALGGWIGLAMLAGSEAEIGRHLIATAPVDGESAEVEIRSPHQFDPENARVRG
jgi:sarcosine oxidase subunit alpha